MFSYHLPVIIIIIYYYLLLFTIILGAAEEIESDKAVRRNEPIQAVTGLQ